MLQLRLLQPELSALGVGRLFLFGSFARDQAGPESDIDLLVDGASERFSVFDLVAVRERLCAALRWPVDVHDFGGFERISAFRAQVGTDLLRVF